MGFEGVGIGPLDLAGGLDLLMEAEERGVPWISANLYRDDNRRLFAPYRLIERGELKIAIVGITGTGTVSEDFVIKNVDDELEEILPTLEPDVDMIILLSSLSFKQTAETVEKFREIDIAVTADRRKGNLQPVHTGNAIITQTSGRGQYQGVLDLQWRDKPWAKDRSSEQVRLKRQLKNLSMQMNQLESLPPKPKAEKKALLERQREHLKSQLEELEEALENTSQQNDQLSSSTYRCRFIPLSPSVRPDRGVEQVIGEAKNRIRGLPKAK